MVPFRPIDCPPKQSKDRQKGARMYPPRQLDGELASRRRSVVVSMSDDGTEFWRLGDGRPKMTKLIVLLSAATLSLGVQLQCAMADEVTNYDVRTSCKADTQAY